MCFAQSFLSVFSFLRRCSRTGETEQDHQADTGGIYTEETRYIEGLREAAIHPGHHPDENDGGTERKAAGGGGGS